MTDRAVRSRASSTAAKKTPATKAAPKQTAAKQTPAKRASTKTATTKKTPAATAGSGQPATAKKSGAAAKKATATKSAPKSVATTTPAKAAGTAPKPATARQISVGTDAAFASGQGSTRRRLRNISEVRHFFRTNDVPIFFFGATPFNLLGLDRWVRNFSYITYYDGWDGTHPRVFTPNHKPYQEFESGEEINNWLLTNAEVRAHIDSVTPRGVRPKVAMVFFDSETEDICRELGYDLILPSASLRQHLDSKIVTTQLGNEAGAPSAPNVLTRVDDWAQLRDVAEKADLGDELVVQTPYGDSGKTTFFISSEADWKKHSADIVGEDIKVMRRINNRPVAVEAVLTRCGTIVGPFMSELIGYRKLTPSRGGWCGNEMYPEVLTPENRRTATQLVRRLGDRLAKEGYRGFFEVDVLVDTDTGDVYLGELNPRISGASSITNVTAGAYADVPLFLFHILEYMNVEFDLDVDEINERWEELAAEDVWSQMILKETDDIVQRLTATPRTGHYSLDAKGTLVFRGPALDWHQLQNETEAFFLRIYGPGDYRWKGADLGVVVTKGRLQVDTGSGKSALAIRARHLIDSIRAEFSGTPVAAPVKPPTTAGVKSG
ncbi:MAG: biotin carboxylase [Actinobacteria bacterium]|nr:biotin carboxylase [Actinomycetota bacterium]